MTEKEKRLNHWIDENFITFYDAWKTAPMVQIWLGQMDTFNQNTPISKIIVVYWILFVDLQRFKLSIPDVIKKVEISSEAKFLNENNISQRIFNVIFNGFASLQEVESLITSNLINFECFFKSTEYVAQTLEAKRGVPLAPFDFITPAEKGKKGYYGSMSETVFNGIITDMIFVRKDIQLIESIWGTKSVAEFEDMKIETLRARRCTLLGFKLFLDCNFFIPVGLDSFYSKDTLILEVLDLLSPSEDLLSSSEYLLLRSYLKKDIVK